MLEIKQWREQSRREKLDHIHINGQVHRRCRLLKLEENEMRDIDIFLCNLDLRSEDLLLLTEATSLADESKWILLYLAANK